MEYSKTPTRWRRDTNSGTRVWWHNSCIDSWEPIFRKLIPSSTDEAAQRRPTLGEFNSTRTRAEPVHILIIFSAIPRQRELRPLKWAAENCLPGVTEEKTYHLPFKGKRAWCCEEHRTKARNTRERGKRVMRRVLAAQSVFEHDPFQHRKNRQ